MLKIQSVIKWFIIILLLFVTITSTIALNENITLEHNKRIYIYSSSYNDAWGVKLRFVNNGYNYTFMNTSLKLTNFTRMFLVYLNNYSIVSSSTNWTQINNTERTFFFNNAVINPSESYILIGDANGDNFGHWWSDGGQSYPYVFYDSKIMNITSFSGLYPFCDINTTACTGWYDIYDRYNGIYKFGIMNGTVVEALPETNYTFTIKAKDKFTNQSLNIFSAFILGENFTTTNGSIYVTLTPSFRQKLINITIYDATENGGYYNAFFDNVNTSLPFYAELNKYFRIYNITYTNFIDYNNMNYTRVLNYKINYTCPSWSSSSLYFLINGVINNTIVPTCNGETQYYNGVFYPSNENIFLSTYYFNTTYANNNYYGVNQSFRGDIYDPVILLLWNTTTGLNVSSVVTINLTCTDNVTPLLTYNLTFNGVKMFYGNKTNNTLQSNTTAGVNGLNTALATCKDFFSTSSASLSREILFKELCLIDELDNVLFKPNITRVRVYIDDNSTLYDFKVNNRSCINFTDLNNNKLRFDFGYQVDTITRYIDPSYIDDNVSKIRVCANKEGIQNYEQLLISVSNTPVVLKSVYANCYIVADSTRFAYQDAYLIKAYTTEALYYLYKFVEGVQVFLASIDGSISTFINLDNLEFRKEVFNLNILRDAITFKQLDNNVTQIYYKNLQGDNVGANITIMRMDTNVVVFSETTFTNYNEITILFDYTTLGVNQSTIFKITGVFMKTDGTTSTSIQYFTPTGKSGQISSGLAFVISMLLMIFGLTLTSTRITFGYFGLFIILGAIAVLSFAVSTWYIIFLISVEVIALIYIILVMVFGSGNSIRGGVV